MVVVAERLTSPDRARDFLGMGGWHRSGATPPRTAPAAWPPGREQRRPGNGTTAGAVRAVVAPEAASVDAGVPVLLLRGGGRPEPLLLPRQSLTKVALSSVGCTVAQLQ